jgi:hypothetical protein
MVVNYAAAEALRFTAFKDMIMSTQVLFDLLLAGETYRLLVHDDAGPRIHQGAVGQFARDYPTFRTFFFVGEAFFLPGFAAPGEPLRTNTAASRLTTRLRSGATARWFARPATLEITKACLTWQTEAGPLPVVLHYQDYRQIEAYYIPSRVTLIDRRLRFMAQAVLKQVEINMPLPSGAFDVSVTP